MKYTSQIEEPGENAVFVFGRVSALPDEALLMWVGVSLNVVHLKETALESSQQRTLCSSAVLHIQQTAVDVLRRRVAFCADE